MWRVVEATGVERQLKQAPGHVRDKYEFWRTVAELDGPVGFRRLAGFRDHALKGEWQGARSCALSRQWRVIYGVRGDELTVLVLEITPHDYRKKS
ncbi:MAG: type II toxin-antitoxin system mRNA interferase toxin, RelE/StbE family [Myxococcales bacterium]|nr:MAG: type II toxin-antitoxin system mRNA interferase toxin, RelE/StbE family [Myxococcales bacterium]